MQDSSAASYPIRNPAAGDHQSAAAYTPCYDRLDPVFQAIRQQLHQWGDQAKWKIELVLLTPQGESSPLQYSLDESAPLQQSAITARRRQQQQHRPTAWQQISATTTSREQSTRELEQKLKDTLKKQKQLESLVKTQYERLRKLQIQPPPRNVNETIDAMQKLHIAMEQEQREKHSVETKLLRKEIHALSRKLKRMQITLQRIENIRNSPDTERLSREELLEERVILIRRLRLAQLRLAARDAELTYLHDVLWVYDQQSNGTPKRKAVDVEASQDDDHSTNGSIESPDSHEISKLESLGIIADQMLSDPKFRLETLSPPNKRIKRTQYTDNLAIYNKDDQPLQHKIFSKASSTDPLSIQPKASESPSIAALLDAPIEPYKHKSAFHSYIQEPYQPSNSSSSTTLSTGASAFYSTGKTDDFPTTLMSPVPSSFNTRPWSIGMQKQQQQQPPQHGNTYSI